MENNDQIVFVPTSENPVKDMEQVFLRVEGENEECSYIRHTSGNYFKKFGYEFMMEEPNETVFQYLKPTKLSELVSKEKDNWIKQFEDLLKVSQDGNCILEQMKKV